MNGNDRGLRRGYAETDRGQIHYAELGEGFPLLLLSATPRTHRGFIPLMRILAPHCRVIAVDMPGFGNSHLLPQPTTIEILAECIASFLEAMKIPEVNVFGLHTGNKLAAELAASHAGKVRNLILAGQSHSIVPERDERNAAIQPWFDKYRLKFSENTDGSHLVREWLNTLVNVEAIWWPKKILVNDVVDLVDIKNAEARAIDFVLGWRSCVPVYEAVFSYDLEHAYRSIKQRTLVLELCTKQEAHLAGQAERVCKILANGAPARLVEMDGLALENNPDLFAEHIKEFLDFS